MRFTEREVETIGKKFIERFKNLTRDDFNYEREDDDEEFTIQIFVSYKSSDIEIYMTYKRGSVTGLDTYECNVWHKNGYNMPNLEKAIEYYLDENLDFERVLGDMEDIVYD